jgi:hypothetical protein
MKEKQADIKICLYHNISIISDKDKTKTLKVCDNGILIR